MAKIRPIGNSIGVIIPKDILSAAGLGDGDEIEIKYKEKRIMLIIERK